MCACVFCSYTSGGTVPDVVSSVSTAVAGVVCRKTSARLGAVTRKTRVKKTTYDQAGRPKGQNTDFKSRDKQMKPSVVTENEYGADLKAFQSRLTSWCCMWTDIIQL